MQSVNKTDYQYQSAVLWYELVVLLIDSVIIALALVS